LEGPEGGLEVEEERKIANDISFHPLQKLVERGGSVRWEGLKPCSLHLEYGFLEKSSFP